MGRSVYVIESMNLIMIFELAVNMICGCYSLI